MERNSMYQIIKTDSLHGIGGELTSVELFRKTSTYEECVAILKVIFDSAMEDDDVEFINHTEPRDIDTENFIYRDALVIQHYCDGMDTQVYRYDIILMDDDDYVKKLKEERDRFLVIAYNAIIESQLNEQYSESALCCELGCTKEELRMIMNE
jgi:hypothetical protein